MVEEVLLTFTNGQSLSNEFISCNGFEKAIGMFFASGANTTSYSFVAYDYKGNAYTLVDLTQTEVVLTVDQTNAKYYPLDPAIFAGVAKFKVRRGTLASPYTTGDENSLIKVTKRVY